MEFGMDKCSTMRIKKGKICDTEDIEMPDGQRMKQIEESGYKYSGIIQDTEIKIHVMKDKIRTEYLRRATKLAKSELYARNVFMGINQWALGVVRYSAGIVDWTRGDLELLDRKIRKMLTCNGLFHPLANVARLYLKRCEVGRGLLSAKDCVLSECNRLWDYLEKSKEPVLKEVVKEDFIMEKEGKKEYDRRTKKRMKPTGRKKAYMESSLKQL